MYSPRLEDFSTALRLDIALAWSGVITSVQLCEAIDLGQVVKESPEEEWIRLPRTLDTSHLLDMGRHGGGHRQVGTHRVEPKLISNIAHTHLQNIMCNRFLGSNFAKIKTTFCLRTSCPSGLV